MSKEKQIKEMAEVMCHSCEGECFRNEDGFADCEACEACLLYDAGYRKQEWISVDERLPEPYEHCLVAAKAGDRMVIDLGHRVKCFDTRTCEHYFEWLITTDWDECESITHWMPLPEPPMMKGGAE